MKLFLSLVFASVSALGISREAGDDIEISCNYDDKYIALAKDKADVFLYVDGQLVLPADGNTFGWEAQLNYDPVSTSTLRLTKKAEKNDAGVYTCKDASANVIQSYEVAIAVTGSFRTTFSADVKTITRGSTVAIGNCTAENFYPNATLTWYYSNGTAIQTNNGASSFSSLLINATEAHNGTQFYCQMDHGDLSNQSTLSEALFVQWAPSNTSVSKEVINNGTQVNLTCSSYASPTPNFQAYGRVKSNWVVRDNIAYTSQTDGADRKMTIKCKASNVLGSTSAAVTLSLPSNSKLALRIRAAKMPVAIAAASIGLLGFLFGVRELTKYLQRVTAPSDAILKTPLPQKTSVVKADTPLPPPPSSLNQPQRSNSEFFM